MRKSGANNTVPILTAYDALHDDFNGNNKQPYNIIYTIKSTLK